MSSLILGVSNILKILQMEQKEHIMVALYLMLVITSGVNVFSRFYC